MVSTIYSRSRILLVAALALVAAGRSRELPPSVLIQGTFLQLWDDHAQWSDSQWDKLFGYFEELQMRTLVVQWTVYDSTAFYESDQFEAVGTLPVEGILKRADGVFS